MSLETYRRSVSEAKRADILKAALAHFLKHGYGSAAMTEIAREAEVSTATLYKHFGSKEELFTAVVTDAANAVRDGFGPIPADKSASDVFLQILLGGLAAQMKNRINDLLRIVIAEAPSSPALAKTVFGVIVEGRYARIKAALDMMIERGLLRPHDTELGARLALGMMKELFVWPSLFDMEFKPPADALDKAREAIDVYVARYGPRAGGEQESR